MQDRRTDVIVHAIGQTNGAILSGDHFLGECAGPIESRDAVAALEVRNTFANLDDLASGVGPGDEGQRRLQLIEPAHD